MISRVFTIQVFYGSEQKCLLYSRCLLAFFPHSICSQHILILYCFPLSALMLLQIWNKFSTQRCYVVCISSFPGGSDVWFSLNGTTYQNNSIVTLEEIGEGGNTLFCITDKGNAIGNWYFPNGSRVPGSGIQSRFFRSRGKMAVNLQRRRGGVEGIYRCEIPDTMNVTQTIYIGVYSARTGEWSILLQ